MKWWNLFRLSLAPLRRLAVLVVLSAAAQDHQENPKQVLESF